MTNSKALFPRLPSFIGFEDLFDALEKSSTYKAPSYPPYNIVKIDDDTWQIELAVAGFSESDIKVEIAGGVLSITGNQEHPNVSYIHRGIGNRSFRQVFNLAETAQVATASLVNGILTVVIEKVIPDHLKPKVIPIGLSSKSADRKLLTE